MVSMTVFGLIAKMIAKNRLHQHPCKAHKACVHMTNPQMFVIRNKQTFNCSDDAPTGLWRQIMKSWYSRNFMPA